MHGCRSGGDGEGSVMLSLPCAAQTDGGLQPCRTNSFMLSFADRPTLSPKLSTVAEEQGPVDSTQSHAVSSIVSLGRRAGVSLSAS